jgi:hypothetical protein
MDALESCERSAQARKEGTDWVCSVSTSPHQAMTSIMQRDVADSPKFQMSLLENAFGPSPSLPKEALSLLDIHATESFAMAKPAKSTSAGKSKGKRSQACSMYLLRTLSPGLLGCILCNILCFLNKIQRGPCLHAIHTVDDSYPCSRSRMYSRCGGLAYHAGS